MTEKPLNFGLVITVTVSQPISKQTFSLMSIIYLLVIWWRDFGIGLIKYPPIFNFFKFSYCSDLMSGKEKLHNDCLKMSKGLIIV